MRAVPTVAVINQKGGVGKTTTVANLGAALAARGHDTCLIDLDPQSHLTLHLGVEPGQPGISTYDVITGGQPLASALVAISPHLWLAPSVIDLAAAEVELVGQVGREQVLRDSLHAAALPHEFALIDCPPSLGLLTLNALAAAEEVLIPLQPHFLALQGLGKLLETVSLVQRRINPGLRVSGVTLCLYEANVRLSSEVVADLRQFFDAARGSPSPWSEARIFQTAIRRNVKLAECPSHGKTIFDYEPRSHGAADYDALAEEFLGAAAARAVQAAPQGDRLSVSLAGCPPGDSAAASPPNPPAAACPPASGDPVPSPACTGAAAANGPPPPK